MICPCCKHGFKCLTACDDYRGELQKFPRNCIQQLWWSYYFRIHVTATFLFLNNHLIFSFIYKYNVFLISKFLQDIALKILGTLNARCIKTKLGIKSFSKKYFGYVILQKLLSNDTKISFLQIFSRFTLFELNLLDYNGHCTLLCR